MSVSSFMVGVCEINVSRVSSSMVGVCQINVSQFLHGRGLYSTTKEEDSIHDAENVLTDEAMFSSFVVQG